MEQTVYHFPTKIRAAEQWRGEGKSKGTKGTSARIKRAEELEAPAMAGEGKERNSHENDQDEHQASAPGDRHKGAKTAKSEVGVRGNWRNNLERSIEEWTTTRRERTKTENKEETKAKEQQSTLKNIRVGIRVSKVRVRGHG